MRILLLNQYFPPDAAASGQFLADVAWALSARGHQVHVICSSGSYSGGRVAGGGEPHLDGVRVHRVNATGRGRLRAVDRLCDWGSYYGLAARQSLRLGRFDACLALTTPPFIGAMGVLLKSFRGSRLVLWTMDLWPEVAEATGAIRARGCVSRLLGLTARWLYRRADAVVSLGPTMTGYLRSLGVPPGKILTVHNWAPAEAVRPLPWGHSYLGGCRQFDGQFVVMYSGNMGMAHEFKTILGAAEILNSDGSIVFLFVGSGTRRSEVVRQAQRRRLKNIRFMEPRPLGQLSELLASAHVHLLSMREGMEGFLVPSKVYGILAAGRPAIMVGSTRNEAARLLTDSRSGFVIKTGGACELAEAIQQLRDCPDLARQMGRAGRTHYEKHLGLDRSVAAIVAAVTGERAAPADPSGGQLPLRVPALPTTLHRARLPSSGDRGWRQ